MDRMLALQYIRTDNERIPFPSVAGYVGCAHLYNVSCVSPAQIVGQAKIYKVSIFKLQYRVWPKILVCTKLWVPRTIFTTLPEVAYPRPF